jgi:DNA-binding LacI/PurR family transcriptional regulator
MKLLHSAHQEITSRGYQLTLCTPGQLRAYPHPIDGCIVQGDLKLVRACAGSGIPMVSLIAAQPGVSAVGTDEAAAFNDITNYLLKLGHRRIAALIGSDESYGKCDMINPLRVKGYTAALAALNIRAPKNWIRRIRKNDSEFTFAHWRHWSYQSMRQWLREDWNSLGCTAIVTQNDSTAIGVIKALRQHGYRVPQDISVTGCDDAGEDALFDIKLTTIHVPLEDIARKAIALLTQSRATLQQKPQKINLPTHVVVGESTSEWKEDAT